MIWLLCLAWLVPGQNAARSPIDASRIQTGSPAIVAEIDTGKLRGEVRRLAWGPEGDLLYLQTVEGKPPGEKAHHYTVALADGKVTSIAEEPDWAAEYWTVKQDRVAPGLPSLQIDVSQAVESIKSGTGPAGVLDRSSNPNTVATVGVSADNLASGIHGDQKANVVRLSFVEVEIAKWINVVKPVPGMKFGWGPRGSGALVFVTEHGGLSFLDQKKRTRPVAGAKDALLPAWSADGGRLAYLQKTGRKTWAVVIQSVD